VLCIKWLPGEVVSRCWAIFDSILSSFSLRNSKGHGRTIEWQFFGKLSGQIDGDIQTVSPINNRSSIYRIKRCSPSVMLGSRVCASRIRFSAKTACIAIVAEDNLVESNWRSSSSWWGMRCVRCSGILRHADCGFHGLEILGRTRFLNLCDVAAKSKPCGGALWRWRTGIYGGHPIWNSTTRRHKKKDYPTLQMLYY
jgi:hypothetical protein